MVVVEILWKLQKIRSSILDDSSRALGCLAEFAVPIAGIFKDLCFVEQLSSDHHVELVFFVANELNIKLEST